MAHDNLRFNVSGKGVDKLAAVLDLYETINGYPSPRLPSGAPFIRWHGYTIHPHLGMLLHRYPGHRGTAFPFNEGATAETLAAFFNNYALSEKGKIEPLPEANPPSYDQYESYRRDANWDRDADHDGENGSGWRVYTGNWGQVLDSDTLLAIKPIYLWYGK